MSKQKFVYVSYIKTTIDVLWKALTSPEFTRKYWLGQSIVCDWKVGSPLKLVKTDGVVVNLGKVLIVEKPKVLSHTWNPQTKEGTSVEAPSRVTFHLEPDEQIVKLTVTHDEFPVNSKVFPQINGGWPVIISSLKSLLETDKPLTGKSSTGTC
ncbi:MAG: SRPBCC family protein [Nitrospirae bacterium]|nr:SRPBCC family protein [Nitrospirota bacterium]